MALESANYISQLVETNPTGGDDRSTSDDHHRLIKKCLVQQFPNFSASAVTVTVTELNTLGSASGNIQAQLDTLSAGLAAVSAGATSASGAWTTAINTVSAAQAASSATLAGRITTNSANITLNDARATSVNARLTSVSAVLSARDDVMSAGVASVNSRVTSVSAKISSISAALSGRDIPTGTYMLFQQTSAPTGWTKQLTHNNKALRVVTGTASSGGTRAFTTALVNGMAEGSAVGSHVLTTAEMPSHQHTYDRAYATATTGGWQVTAGNDDGLYSTQSSGATGGGGGHAHTLSLGVQYIDVIVAIKT